MSDLVVRVADKEDITALLQLEVANFETDRLSRKQFLHFIQSQTAAVLVVEKDHMVVGAAVIMFRKNSAIARLYSIAVDPTLLGQGISQKLHERIVTLALEKGCSEIRLEVRPDNPRAIQFYRKNDYQAIGEYEAFYEDGADALRMSKSLNDMKLK